ncbi:MAG: serine protease, partial [Planctomycetota bacterium]|nr:serine protease [Planctomycetota bacterium]
MKLRIVACALALAVVYAASAQAADFKETARKVAESASKSVVTVRVVCSLKLTIQGQNMDQEQKNEVPGTVIDPSGLTVVSATMLDPSAALKRMLAGVKLDASIKDTTLILADGTEVPAEVVMKDTDLDMAFVRPKDTTKTFDAVTLKPRSAQPRILDDVFVVGRMGKEGNRTHTVELGTIRAQVKGPRSFYLCSGEVSENPGCIVYTADGEPL